MVEDLGLTVEPLLPPDVFGGFVIVPLLGSAEGVTFLFFAEVSAELLRFVIVPIPSFVKGGTLFCSAAVGGR